MRALRSVRGVLANLAAPPRVHGSRAECSRTGLPLRARMAPSAECSRTGLPLRATARPMLPIQPAALHWARAPRQPGPLARRRVARLVGRARLCAGVARVGPATAAPAYAPVGRGSARAARAQATAGTARRDAVRVYRFSRTEAAQRRARCPQGEPSAMLPAVSAALAERSPEGHRDA